MIGRTTVASAFACSMLLMGCSESSSSGTTVTVTVTTTTTSTTASSTTADTATTDSSPPGAPVAFEAQVWADNWFSLYVNGELVGEDSVPITTERSFNAETITFSATYPLTVAMVAKDFKETDSGLEYIGTDRQQMGDGGLIAQITDTRTGEVVARTNGTWRGLVIHAAPTNTECESSADPDVDCQFVIVDEPAGWIDAEFDDSAWLAATEYTAEEVGAKDGYNEVAWAPEAKLIWSSDLKVDNTILWRVTVTDS